jgi:hypothetical protein
MEFSKITVTAFRYTIGDHMVSDPVVRYDGKSLRCDDRKLPPSLVRLIPHAWGNATAEAWKPFVERAIVLGYL